MCDSLIHLHCFGSFDAVMAETCYVSAGSGGDATKWVGYSLCSVWCHVKCAHLTGVKPDSLKLINWVCFSCIGRAKLALSLVDEVDDLHSKVSGL